MFEEEIGRIKKNATTDIVVKVDDYGGEKGVTIREFVASPTYTGFTKQGTRINKESWPKFKELMDKIILE